MSETLALAQALIARPSVTPDDAGCQALLAARLATRGFRCTHLRFGEVDNLWAEIGADAPLLVFVGHTDVVPPGPRTSWRSDPFVPELRDGRLYGRGAADMKSSIAAMVTAVEDWLGSGKSFRGSFAFLLTSDEEGPSVDGTVRVVDWLQQRGIRPDWCLVGEPSSSVTVGDTVKNGRRGSLSGQLTVQGVQGHVAYPDLARNPIHLAVPALQELTHSDWGRGNEFFPPTSLQISNINSGTGAENVIPGSLSASFNFRYSTDWSDAALRQRVEEILQRHGLSYTIQWKKSGDPFLTRSGRLLESVSAAIEQITGSQAQISTAGGTSDGRFIAPLGTEVVELGPVNASIHKVDEWVSVAELETLTHIYRQILERLFQA